MGISLINRPLPPHLRRILKVEKFKGEFRILLLKEKCYLSKIKLCLSKKIKLSLSKRKTSRPRPSLPKRRTTHEDLE